jgi:tetratricopeptide (TPR) repeat protein
MLVNTSAPSSRNANTLLNGLHKFVRFVLLSLKYLAHWVAMPFRWWWRSMADLKVGIPLTILLVPLVLAGWAMLLHWWMPRPEVIVSPFELPAGATGIPWTGRTVANLFIDELQEIIRSANEFHGQQFASRRQYKKMPDLPKIPIEKSFELQIQGLSFKQIMSAWDYLRYDQQLFSEDVILGPDNTLILRARVASDKQARYWEVSELKSNSKIPRTLDGLKLGLRELAVQVFTSLNPETVGRYFLATAMASRDQDQDQVRESGEEAARVFKQWIQREPTRPEPFFYLSYTYSNFPERLEDAKHAAEQALNNDKTYYLAQGEIAYVLNQEAWKGKKADRRQRLIQAANADEHALRMARKWWQFGKWWPFAKWWQFWKGWQFWREGPPNYWNNLCREYSDIGWFAKAERACDNAKLNDPDFSVPSISLGYLYQTRAEKRAPSESEAAKKDLEDAAKAYRAALRKQPDNFAGLTGLRTALLSNLWDRHDEAARDKTKPDEAKYQEARSECEKAVAAFPWAAEPLIELGKVFEAEKHPSLAKEQYLRATKVDERNPAGWRALALAEFNDNHFEKSVKNYQIAFKLSGDPAIKARIGAALAMQGAAADGLKYMEEALKFLPALADEPWFKSDRDNAQLLEPLDFPGVH